MTRRVSCVLLLTLLLCAAGAASGQTPVPCENKPIKDPAYFADIKEWPPGKYGFSYTFDQPQTDDPASPAALTGLGSHSAPRPRAIKLSCAEVVNRTSRVIRSVRLRWTVTARAEDGSAVKNAEPLAKGLTRFFDVEVPPGERRKFELRDIHIADFFWPLAAAGEVNGKFHVSVGVARVEFTDGTAIDLP